MRNLDEVLKELNEAEKEYQAKCKKYGIEEKHKRKIVEENPTEQTVEVTATEQSAN